ncbi:MAG TPA: hypothetical protein DIU07_16925 [Rhodobacteraceae bacterium]|nr:hypothetical protein [Paracoccaceae bacterium]
MTKVYETGALPNVVVIGAMKCGTTSLHEFLALHPDVCASEPKEINFFSGENADKPLDWYKAYFDPTKPVRVESSQNYSKAHYPFYAGAPARMAETIPDAKLIYLVRDPIERYRSHVAENFIGETSDDLRWIEKNNHRVMTGLYHYQLSAFLEFYDLDRIRVVDLADLSRDPLATMNELFAFLDLPQVDDPSLFDFRVNANGEDVLPRRLRTSLPYRAARKVAPGAVNAVFRWPPVRKAFLSKSYKPQLPTEEIERLKAEIAPDMARFRSLTGMDFPDWSV